MFNRYPYTDAHQLNLDWIIKQVKKIPKLAASIPTKLSELLNDAGFINAAQAAAAAPVQSVNGQTGNVIVSGGGAVDSVNGQTGAVVLSASDVGALPDSYTAPVASVNGQTGTVVLDADDVGALPDSYTAPVASVNGQTGAVVLSASDVGALPDSYTAPVASVNGQTGTVVINTGQFEMRSVSWAYSVSASGSTNTNLKTLIDADLPSGHRCLGVVGFTTSDVRVVPISVRYVDSNYSLQVRNLDSSAHNYTMAIYYLCTDL